MSVLAAMLIQLCLLALLSSAPLSHVFVETQRVSTDLYSLPPGRWQLALAQELDQVASSALCGSSEAVAVDRCCKALLAVVDSINDVRAARISALIALTRMVQLGTLESLTPGHRMALLSHMAASARQALVRAPSGERALGFAGSDRERAAALGLVRESVIGALQALESNSTSSAEASIIEAAASIVLSAFRLCSEIACTSNVNPQTAPPSLGPPAALEALEVASLVLTRTLELQCIQGPGAGEGSRVAPHREPARDKAERWLWEQFLADIERMLQGDLITLPGTVPRDRSLIGLHLFSALLCTPSAGLDPSASTAAAALAEALGARMFPALHSVGRNDDFITRALWLLPLIHSLPCAKRLQNELLWSLIQLPLHLLTEAASARPTHRLAALRCLGSMLQRPHAARALLVLGDLSTHGPRAWEATIVALSTPTPLRGNRLDLLAILQESRLRVRICGSILGQLSSEQGDARKDEGGGEQGMLTGTGARHSSVGPGVDGDAAMSLDVMGALRLRTAIDSAAEAMACGGGKSAVSTLQAAGLLEESLAGDMVAGATAGAATGGADARSGRRGDFEDRFGERLGQLLFEAGDFSPREVGELLTLPGRRYATSLTSFLRHFDFGHLSLTDALRLLFAALRCPGEAQKIDRLMEAFAERYYGEGRPPFSDKDEVYTTAFSVMMLNVDLHNTAVRDKMTREQFVTNTRRAAKTLPAGFLGSLYDAVLASELKAHDPPRRLAVQPVGQADMQAGIPPQVHPASEPLSRWRWRILRMRRGVRAGVGVTDPPTPLWDAVSSLRGRGLDERVAAPLLPVAVDVAARLLAVSGHDGPLASMPEAAPFMDSIPGEPADYRAALQLLLLALRQDHKLSASLPNGLGFDGPRAVAPGIARPPVARPHSLVDCAVAALCTGSRLAAHLPDQSESAREACFAERPMHLVTAAFALARELPFELGHAGWHGVVLALLSMQQLGLCSTPSALQSPVRAAHVPVNRVTGAEKGPGGNVEAESGSDGGGGVAVDVESSTTLSAKLKAEAIERAARLIERTLNSAAQPSSLEPLWMRQRSCAAELELVQPSTLLSCASSLPSASLAALVGALLQAVDECVLLSLRNPHAGSLPAASAIQLLAEAVCGPSGAKAVPAATAAAIDRCQRVLATPNCPLPVQHAAGRALVLLRQDLVRPQWAPPHAQYSLQPSGATRAAPFPRQQERAAAAWQQVQQPERAPEIAANTQRPHPLDFPPQI